MHPVEQYLRSLKTIRDTGGGTDETSCYGPLEVLFNEAGAALDPKVRAVPQLRESGAGRPDFGFFTAARMEPGPATGAGVPDRGAVEVKPFATSIGDLAASEQVREYLEHYGLILATNFRQFQLVARGPRGGVQLLEKFDLAASTAEFDGQLARPHRVVDERGDRLLDYLRRVQAHEAPIRAPQQLADTLASYAREARIRLDERGELPGLSQLKSDLEAVLGMRFEGEDGAHFFRATLVQTLFYGLFAAWVLWSREGAAGEFDWRRAAWSLRVPMVRGLFEQVATPSRLGSLGLTELLDWAGQALDRVEAAPFFEAFGQEQAVQYFYEPFLAAYDPELRKQLGVWYTPPEIVRYQVARVDRVLRDELGLADGLADPSVVVLDPCCGTGAYLVECLRLVHERLVDSQGASAAPMLLQRAACERIFGFEILPAPFVVSHLQIGLLLAELGAPFDEGGGARAGVYLTNALVGWDPAAPPKSGLPMFPELAAERDAAERVKQREPILVILGNPPYNAYAGTATDEEGDLVARYKQSLNRPVVEGGWGIRKFNLDDLYVRFFRVAERKIAASGRGVLCYISNYSWTEEASFVVMRESLLATFDRIWIENLHGNRKISEYAPDGRVSETVFALAGHSPGIQQGVAVALLVKSSPGESPATVLYRDDLQNARAEDRRAALLESLADSDFDSSYEAAEPEVTNRLCLRPLIIASEYLSWPSPLDLCSAAPSNGLMEKRGGALIDSDREALAERMRRYLDPSLDWEAVRHEIGGLGRNAASFFARGSRQKALQTERFEERSVCRYSLRPGDTRWCYVTAASSVWNRCRPLYLRQAWPGNEFFMTRTRTTAVPEGLPVSWVRGLSDDHYMTPDNVVFPVWLRDEDDGLFDGHAPEYRANLSAPARAYLASLGLPDPDTDFETAALLWRHALAVGCSPAYLAEHADGVRTGWPRVPLPRDADSLCTSAVLGQALGELLDPDRPVAGVTQGRLRTELRTIGVLARIDGGAVNPAAGDLELRAGWGHAGRAGVTMPGRGRVESAPPAAADDPLGPERLDIHLNERVAWRSVPRSVWEFHVGGYQVVKKWLSYREFVLLGRPLTLEEAQHVGGVFRRLAALVLLQPELDANYRSCRDGAVAWPVREAR